MTSNANRVLEEALQLAPNERATSPHAERRGSAFVFVVGMAEV